MKIHGYEEPTPTSVGSGAKATAGRGTGRKPVGRVFTFIPLHRLFIENWYNVNTMTTITIDEIQRDLRDFIHRVVAGENMFIIDKDKAVAEIKPIEQPLTQSRPYGLAKGDFIVPNDFNSRLPDDIENLFSGYTE